MGVDIKALYKVVGEEGPILKRVEEALAWLLSPKAEGIGEKLLRDAHALHGKPVTIVATTTEQTAYYNMLGEHAVKINPKHIAGVTLKAADGTSHVMSVERTLAHELVHAGQKEATVEVENALEAIKVRAQTKAMERFSEQEIAQSQSHLTKALDAPDYHTARKHVEEYVDKVALPMNTETMAHLHADPEFVQYTQTLEVPAMAVENRVAQIRGEPVRGDYAHAHDIEPASLREMMIDEVSKELELHAKPMITEPQREDGKKWADSLGDRSGRRLG